MKRCFAALILAGSAWSQPATESPTGPRITPPTIMSVAPLGVSRGATAELTIEGFNLAGATAIHFSQPGIKARIVRIKELPDLPDIRLGSNGTPSTVDLGPLPPRNQVTVEVDISPDAPVTAVGFRVQTPLGASPEGKFLIEPYYGESPDREPNGTPETAFETYLPTILVGTISRPGDLDFYKITAKAGDQIVFENAQATLGSALQPLIAILDEGQNVVREFGARGERENTFAHKFEKAGTYYIRIADYQESGSARHFYRIKTGSLPLATSAFPLGVQRGKSAEVALGGYNLAASKIAVHGRPSPEDDRLVILRPEGKSGQAFNEVKLALGDNPEVLAAGVNVSVDAAQTVAAPVTVNGILGKPEHYFRFKAKKGEALVVEVAANRLGSPLDSMVEVLDAKGKPIERATIRPVLETNTVLRDHESSAAGIRLNSVAGLAANDYIMIDSEIMRIDSIPRQPDEDTKMMNFGGQRIAYFDTTPEAHAADSRVFKVQIHPPGAQFALNGLPLARLTYRNDDGGPGYGKDSRLRFTAPADGEYVVRLRDVRGMAGADFAYRLMIQPAHPDFRLSVAPRNPNVPPGGRIPLTVVAQRLDDFDGPIEVAVEDLPAGFEATKGVIGAGQVSTTLLLSASSSAKLEKSAPLKVAGRAGSLRHEANPDDTLKLITLMPAPDIQMTAETREVTLDAGGTAEVWVSIKRNNGFGGRVPVEVRNLPPSVRIIDIGLNGVLINEDETRRSFKIEALPSAEALEQPIYVAGAIETRAAGQQNSFAGEPILLKIKSRAQLTQSTPPPTARTSATK